MTDTELINKLLDTLTEVSEKVSKIEPTERQINELTVQVKELAAAFYKTAARLEERIEVLEKADKEKLWAVWEKAKSIIITIVTTGAVTFILTRLGFSK